MLVSDAVIWLFDVAISASMWLCIHLLHLNRSCRLKVTLGEVRHSQTWHWSHWEAKLRAPCSTGVLFSLSVNGEALSFTKRGASSETCICLPLYLAQQAAPSHSHLDSEAQGRGNRLTGRHEADSNRPSGKENWRENVLLYSTLQSFTTF